MLFQPKPNDLQERLDQTRDLEDAVADQAAAADEDAGFQMTGLYELIPGTDPSPLPINSLNRQA